MRLSIMALIAAAALSSAPMAHAAPTCVDESNTVRRCGAPGAMPVGWTPSSDAVEDQPQPAPEDPSMIFGLVCILGGLFGLIALMPDFDGEWRATPFDKDD